MENQFSKVVVVLLLSCLALPQLGLGQEAEPMRVCKERFEDESRWTLYLANVACQMIHSEELGLSEEQIARMEELDRFFNQSLINADLEDAEAFAEAEAIKLSKAEQVLSTAKEILGDKYENVVHKVNRRYIGVRVNNPNDPLLLSSEILAEELQLTDEQKEKIKEEVKLAQQLMEEEQLQFKQKRLELAKERWETLKKHLDVEQISKYESLLGEWVFLESH